MSLRPQNLGAARFTAYALCLIAIFALHARAQTPTPTPSPTPSTSPCAPPPSCPTLAPRLIELTAVYKKGNEPLAQDEGTKLARKRFYISSCPFNLEKIQTSGSAPTRRSFYAGVKASDQLIKWLEANNCDTVYCRELRREEVTCNPSDANCVPEFTRAYAEALRKLKNEELARKWVTNYEPLASADLRTGFFRAKAKWLEAAVAASEKASGLPAGSIKSTMTDRSGVAYFYDLCPGTYYISNIAPTDVEGDRILWETTAITIKAARAGEPDQVSMTKVFLANVTSKKKRTNFFVGKRVSDAVSNPSPRAEEKSAGQ